MEKGHKSHLVMFVILSMVLLVAANVAYAQASSSKGAATTPAQKWDPNVSKGATNISPSQGKFTPPAPFQQLPTVIVATETKGVSQGNISANVSVVVNSENTAEQVGETGSSWHSEGGTLSGGSAESSAEAVTAAGSMLPDAKENTQSKGKQGGDTGKPANAVADAAKPKEEVTTAQPANIEEGFVQKIFKRLFRLFGR